MTLLPVLDTKQPRKLIKAMATEGKLLIRAALDDQPSGQVKLIREGVCLLSTAGYNACVLAGATFLADLARVFIGTLPELAAQDSPPDLKPPSTAAGLGQKPANDADSPRLFVVFNELLQLGQQLREATAEKKPELLQRAESLRAEYVALRVEALTMPTLQQYDVMLERAVLEFRSRLLVEEWIQGSLSPEQYQTLTKIQELLKGLAKLSAEAEVERAFGPGGLGTH